MKELKNTYNKFGKKIKSLLELTKNTTDWNKYVDNNTEKLINDLINLKNISAVMEKNNITYGNLRAKYLIAIRRIENKDNTQMRGAKSAKAIYLFNLLNKNPDWKDCLTEKEILYIESFKELKNFYAVARKFNVSPSNVAGSIYGTKQRLGAVKKIERNIKK